MIVNDNGMFVDDSTSPPTAVGYIFNFQGHGSYAPNGRCGEFTDAQVEQHNKLLAEAMWKAMLERGRGVLYVSHPPGEFQTVADGLRRPRYGYGNVTVSDWAGVRRIAGRGKRGTHCCFGGRVDRYDVWFNIDGEPWYGICRGDNQILRCRKLKAA